MSQGDGPQGLSNQEFEMQQRLSAAIQRNETLSAENEQLASDLEDAGVMIKVLIDKIKSKP